MLKRIKKQVRTTVFWLSHVNILGYMLPDPFLGSEMYCQEHVHLQCHTGGITTMHGCHEGCGCHTRRVPRRWTAWSEVRQWENMEPAQFVSYPTYKLCDLRQVT